MDVLVMKYSTSYLSFVVSIYIDVRYCSLFSSSADEVFDIAICVQFTAGKIEWRNEGVWLRPSRLDLS